MHFGGSSWYRWWLAQITQYLIVTKCDDCRFTCSFPRPLLDARSLAPSSTWMITLSKVYCGGHNSCLRHFFPRFQSNNLHNPASWSQALGKVSTVSGGNYSSLDLPGLCRQISRSLILCLPKFYAVKTARRIDFEHCRPHREIRMLDSPALSQPSSWNLISHLSSLSSYSYSLETLPLVITVNSTFAWEL